jgi:hypothetical protein
MDTAFPECPGCVAAARKIAQQEREIGQLQARLNQLEGRVEALTRSAKRQAAPFSRRPPKDNPQKPGRKPGPDYGTCAFRTIPEKIDEFYDAPLPEKCPYCGGAAFRGVHMQEQYQVEIPRQANTVAVRNHGPLAATSCCPRCYFVPAGMFSSMLRFFSRMTRSRMAYKSCSASGSFTCAGPAAGDDAGT